MMRTGTNRALRDRVLFLTSKAFKAQSLPVAILLVERLQELLGIVLLPVWAAIQTCAAAESARSADFPPTTPHTSRESQHHRSADAAVQHRYARPHTTQMESARQLRASAAAAVLGCLNPGDSTIAGCGKLHPPNSHHRLDPSHAAAAPEMTTADCMPSIFDSAINPSALAAKTSLIIADRRRTFPMPLSTVKVANLRQEVTPPKLLSTTLQTRGLQSS